MEQNKYVKPVEAVRLTDDNIEVACLWLKGLGEIRKDGKGRYIMLLLDGQVAGVGQWIIKDAHGLEYNVLPDEAFQRLYRPEQPSPSPMEVVVATLEYYQGIIAGFADRAGNDHERNICNHDFGNLTTAIKTIGMYKSFIDEAGLPPASSGETMSWVRWEDKPPHIGQILYIKESINGRWQRELIFHDCVTSPTDETMKQRGVFYLDESASPSDTRDTDAIHEREVMIQAFDKVRQIFEGRKWIMEGRGAYPYNDDRYKEEVRYMYDEFDALEKDTWANIRSKSVDYRKQVIEQYLKETGTREEAFELWLKDNGYQLFTYHKGNKDHAFTRDYLHTLYTQSLNK